MSFQPHSTSSHTPSLPQVQILLGPYSIEVIQTWLRYKKLPFSATSRADIAKRVHKLIEDGKLLYDELTRGLVGIEESAAKHVYVYTVEPEDGFVNVAAKQLSDLKVVTAPSRLPATAVTKTPKLVYAINDAKEIRIKWAEIQTRVTLDKKTLSPKKELIPRIVVFALDKKTGIAQLRYDTPLQEHFHKINGESKAHAYYKFYLEKAENHTGLSLKTKDLHEPLKKLLFAVPPVVIPVTVATIGEDSGTTTFGTRKKGGDPRQTKDWKSAHDQDSQPRTYESAPLRWEPHATNSKLLRPVRCNVEATEGMIRFDADCNEEEVSYVLSRFV